MKGVSEFYSLHILQSLQDVVPHGGPEIYRFAIQNFYIKGKYEQLRGRSRLVMALYKLERQICLMVTNRPEDMIWSER